jgi:hypothetical protein
MDRTSPTPSPAGIASSSKSPDISGITGKLLKRRRGTSSLPSVILCASAAATPLPSLTPPAASTGTGDTASTIEGTWTKVVRTAGKQIPDKDVAVLKVERNNLPTVPLGDGREFHVDRRGPEVNFAQIAREHSGTFFEEKDDSEDD